MSGSSWGPVATDTLSRWGHRLLTAEDGSRRTLTGSVDGAPRWVGGLAAGLQAALLSLAVVVVPTVAAYVATSADPSNADVGWPRSVAVGAGLWLLAHGSPLDVDGARVTLVPLGLSGLALFAAYASARRSGRVSTSGWGAGVAGYVAVALLVALLSGGSGVVRAVLGSALVAAVGLGAGLLAQPGAPRLRDLTAPVWRRCPVPVRVGAAGGVMATAALVVVASAVVVGWTVARRAAIAEVVASLGVDLVGWTTLTLVQLALVPDLVAWALALVVGPGFAVGAGTHFAAAQVVSGPLPAIPLLGALPSPGVTTPWAGWAPAVTVAAVGAAAGWRLHRHLPRGRWWHPPLACAAAAVVAGLGAGVVVALASGSVGPGRMAVVGGSGVLVGAVTAIGTLVGSAVVVLPASPEVRDEVSRRWRRVRHAGDAGVLGDAATDGAADDRVVPHHDPHPDPHLDPDLGADPDPGTAPADPGSGARATGGPGGRDGARDGGDDDDPDGEDGDDGGRRVRTPGRAAARTGRTTREDHPRPVPPGGEPGGD